MRQLLIGLGLVVLAFLAISAFSLWQDGNHLTTATQAPHRAARRPAGQVTTSSYLDASQFQWTTEAVLREYARTHHAAILEEMQREQQP